jgi:uncharacterized membrane protein
MNRGSTWLTGFGLGAGAMYLLDPVLGRRRRALLRDQLTSATCQADNYLGATWTDVRNRAQGLASEATALFKHERPDDEVLVERVRSKMGRYLSHPGAIRVAARDGRVMLSGPILAREVDWLMDAVASVPGVTGVEDRLEIHARAGDVSALQGGGRRPGERFNLAEYNWAPSTRLLVGGVGGALLAYGFTRRFPAACVLGTAGLGLLARAVTNTDLKRLLGVGGGRRAVDVQKTLTIGGPVERVFPLFSRYDAFPSFMAHLREVRDLGDGRSRWVAEGPAGTPVSWDAVITRFEPNRLLAWRSEPGSAIPNAGILRFEPTRDDKTRLTMRFSYNPPGGMLGHFAAKLFGADAKSAMDDDLARLKSLIEEGKTSAPGKEQTAFQEVEPAGPRPAL